MPEGLSENLIALVRSGIKNKKEQIDFGTLDLELLTKFASAHQVCYLVYSALIKCGADKSDPKIKSLFLSASRELLHSEHQSQAADKITEALTQSGIDFMPLKGYTLKQIYPERAMRVMGDIDILTDVAQYPKVSAVMDSLGYAFVCESDHEYIYKKDGVVIEFHKRLIPSYNEDFYEYFGDGLSRAAKTDSGRYAMSAEDTFIYLFLHFAKHYRDGGIGIKHVCDLYLYLERENPDRAKIEKALGSVGLSEFYKNILDMLGAWFDEKAQTDKTRHITQVIIMSGAFGRHREKVYAQALRAAANRQGRIISRVFPPVSVMKIKYKYLEKAPFLLPFAWVLRIFAAVIKKPNKLGRMFSEQVKVTGDDVTDYKNALLYVGLSFDKRKDK